MSGTYPTSPEFRSINFSSEQKTKTSTTDSGKMFSTQVDGQRFKFSATYPPMSRSDFAPVLAFIMKQRSGKENFTIVPPDISSTRGNETGTILVNGVHTAGDTTIAIDGHASDGAGRFKSGDMIKFASHDKVYMIVADATSSSNASTITIEPPLRNALANYEAVTYNNVPFTVYLLNDMQEFGQVGADKDGNILYKFELDVEEAL